jgi:hypothetical protein
MPRINWIHVLLGGLIAGLVWTFLSVLLLAFVGHDLLSTLPGAGSNAPATVHIFLLLSNFAAATWALWLFAVIRPGHKAGFTPAIVAAFAWWFLVSLQSVKWATLLLLPGRSVALFLVTTLPAMTGAVMVGAWVHDRVSSVVHRA